jgi:predicted transcriptional regulator
MKKNNNVELLRFLGRTIGEYYIADVLAFFEEKKQKEEEDATIEMVAEATSVVYARAQLISKMMENEGLIYKNKNKTGMGKHFMITPYGRRVARLLLPLLNTPRK